MKQFTLLIIIYLSFIGLRNKSIKANLYNSSKRETSLSHHNMVYIPGGVFDMGGDNKQAFPDEFPKHKVVLDGFWMDCTEVTNAQFAEFVSATHYVTTAEKVIDWEELKKQLPPNTTKPADTELQPAALVFKIPANDNEFWWKIVPGANWKHPEGPNSSIVGKDNYPVVQISWDDAQAYCQWAHKRLPTEAEWEYAARGKLKNKIYTWGNEQINQGIAKANSWQGNFPIKNTNEDTFIKLAPVKSFASNGYGLYDMAGNVWEWCQDWYDANYYLTVAKGVKNPHGPSKGYDPEDTSAQKRTIRGGSFLCNDGYCSGYRNARRMKETPDTGMEHIGFRCVSDK
jgi:formylglycine-generating enzyme required for sulfatase activity